MFQVGPHDSCHLVDIGSTSVASASRCYFASTALQPSQSIGGNSLDPDCTLAANLCGELANMKQVTWNDYLAKDNFKHAPCGSPDKCPMSTALKPT